MLRLQKYPLSAVNSAFSWCHQYIYRKDDISQSEAFSEFVKLIALKLLSDRRIKERYPAILNQNAIDVPAGDAPLPWIKTHEEGSHNPINDVQFRSFIADMEKEIAREQRRRIFESADVIRLKPETIRGVVNKLQNIFLFGVDADLNGSLFETFLNATMRGKDLGQFFTPRTLVKLGIGLAQLKVYAPDGNGRYHTDAVVHACCGTGGFLIDALADMWSKAERKNISETERRELKKTIANDHVVGIDVANAPKLARTLIPLGPARSGTSHMRRPGAVFTRLPARMLTVPEATA